MKYEELRNFILYDMKLDKSYGETKNYQPVMILVLNQNHGKATKKEITYALEKANSNRILPEGSFDTVCKTLQGHKIVERKGDEYFLLDYDTIDKFFGRKAEITKRCYEKIGGSFVKSTLESILTDKNSNEDTRFFIALGPWSNWEHSLNNPPFRWGVNPSSASNVGVFDALRPEDIVYYYANKDNPTPFSKRGLFGVGKVIRKYDEDEERYWPDEKLKDEIIYKHRFEIESLKLVQSDSEMLPWIDGLPFTKGLNRIADENNLKKLIDNTEKIWNIKLNDSAIDVFLSEKDFENMVNAIPLVVEYNKTQLTESDTRIPKAEDIQLCARMQYYCALQSADLEKITLENIDLKNYEIKITRENRKSIFSTATIHPLIKNDLEIYLENKSQNEILFTFNRQLLWQYYKKAGELAKINLSKEQTEREIKGITAKILIESRGRHMLEKGASEGLVRLKFQLTSKEEFFKSIQPTLQELKDWERREYENTLSVIKTNSNYFLLRHKTGSVNQWRDDIGKQYHFGKIQNYKKIIPGTKTIWFDRENGDFYFWGYGEITKIEKESEEHFHGHYDQFHFFNEPQKANPGTDDVIAKKGLDSTGDKIMELPGWNSQMSMIEITKDIYDEIINGKSVATYLKNKSLSIPTASELKLGIEKIQEELLIDSDTIQEIVINLASGRHVLLAGPVGTGKTQLAILIPKTFWVNDGGYYSEVHTATADWSTQDVIGGIVPKMVENDVKYEIQHGCVTETILENWDSKACQNRIQNQHEGHTYNGTWLVIDEFNRADIDKAFGPLFTSLETRSLKIPSDKEFESQIEIKIPKDYRIIGTLNTADKHYLFRLSDALKRRFAYIEVVSPSRKQKDNEIFYALKNAIRDLPSKEKFEWFSLKESEKVIDEEKSNKEFLAVLNNAYDVLDFIRASKPLGTAILKSIYQTLLIGSKITEDFNKSLDLSLNTNLIPQLENVQTTTLETIAEFFTGDVTKLFQEKQDSPVRERYVDDFKMILNYVGVKGVEKKTEKYSKGELKEEDAWAAIKSRIDEKRLDIKLNVFPNSIRELVKASTLI